MLVSELLSYIVNWFFLQLYFLGLVFEFNLIE